MRAGVYVGKESIHVEERPLPQLQAGEALVHVRYAGICGTDMLIYSGKHPRVAPPRVLGHEVFGSVVEVNSPHGAEWKPGQRVAVYPLISCGRCAPCREGNAHVCEKLGLIGIDVDGGFAEYVKVTSEQLVAVPEGVSDEQAAVIEPLSVAIHAVRRSSFQTGDTVLVTGGGPIGNLIAQVLRASGARRVIISETKKFRRELAQRLGFAVVDSGSDNLAEALQSLLGEPFVDRVFEATGAPAVYPEAVKICKVRGEIVFVGLPKTSPGIDVISLVFKEIHTTGARVYTRKDYLAAVALLQRSAVDVVALITDCLALDEANLGFQKMREADTSLKILFGTQ
ncbi:MAG: zinc-binding dehydrogenase [Acidobacteria bacterium]|nr:MAG: zinc-binding dehydrogenase [Acidobacteriota bacterium]